MNLKGTTRPLVAIGLMSGTSLDGVDAALIETDGESITTIGPALTVPYLDPFRKKLKEAVEIAGATNTESGDHELADELTRIHVDVIRELLSDEQPSSKWARPDLIGFHGHTVLHRPEQKITQQIGNPAKLANDIGVPVVYDFRSNDVVNGGQGAPLAPVYHAALLQNEDKPIAVVNIGGIANVTWLGESNHEVIAFDTGPGNALMDAWVERCTGERFDNNGSLAANGAIDQKALTQLLENPYFQLGYPKSLDRSDFSIKPIIGLSPADGTATLCAFTAQSIISSFSLCPKLPKKLYVTGGGRHNETLMAEISARSHCSVEKVDSVGVNGDDLEAQAFAFMAVRSVRGLPLSFKGTTGVSEPLMGGKLIEPDLPKGKLD
ncbi:MAG: anhydro-N-acetylmuramic acid kinase [Rhodospirillaceae bacterium]